MLTPRQIEEAADTLVPIWDELKEWITLDLIDRIMARLGNDDISLSRSELWRVEVFKDAGGLLDELQARIKRALGISDNELRRVFIDCGVKAAANDSAVYAHNTAPAAAQAHERVRSEELLSADYRAPEGRTGSRNEKQQKRPLENISERMRDIMNDAYTRTSGELRNFTGTTADSVQVQFIRELDRAYLKVASGACSQWQAAQEAVDSIIDQQGTVTYPSGHVDTIEVAVIRAIRTGISRMSGALAIESALEHGLNHVLVSSHLGARVGSGEPGHDNHAWWQGKVYTIEGSSDKYPNLEQATGYPTDPRGLCGYNCRHNMQPFDPDVMINNTRQYDEEENEEAYNASQEMRRMERRLRKQSTTVKALERAEDICRDEKLKESFRYDRELAEKRYEELKRSYLDYCSGHGVRPSYERLFTAKDRAGKTDNSSGGISTSVSVANSGNGGIIKSIDVDDYELVTYGKGIKPEVSAVIIDTMKQCEKNGGFVISEISTDIMPTSTQGTPVLQIEPMNNGLLKLNINDKFLSDKSLIEIDSIFENSTGTVVNSLEEAIIHESGHALSISGKSIEVIKKTYKELAEIHHKGVSPIAFKDGAECLAELEVLRYRGTQVTEELKSFYRKYMGREY